MEPLLAVDNPHDKQRRRALQVVGEALHAARSCRGWSHGSDSQLIQDIAQSAYEWAQYMTANTN